jgi:hypothetical protein
MKIVAAEHYPKWALRTLQKLVDLEHTTFNIEDSDLPRLPFKLSDFEPR